MQYQSIEQTAAALASGALSSVALVERHLARIGRLDEKLHAFVDVYAEEALESAVALDRLRAAGVTLGPLHGVTLAVKDLFEIEGRPITGGSIALPARTSTLTASAVSRLRQAGAIVLGKTHTVEFAFGGWGTNAVMGTPWNPWDMHTHRVPGGSSSGSAVAVAAGLACAAIGTDTGGSVRIPAGLCGLVGLKTTRGLISRHGLIDLCPTHDTVGPLSRTVKDCAMLLDVLAGADPLDAVSLAAPVRSVLPLLDRGVAGMRAWVLPETERREVEPAVLAVYDATLAALRALGMVLIDQPLPQSCSDYMRIAGSLMSAEGYASLGKLFERDDLVFDPHVKRRILLGRDIDAAQYIALLKRRTEAQAQMLLAMEGIDVCVFPTNAVSAIPVDQVDEMATPLSRFGRFVNLLDLCSVAIPAGFSSAGMPISVQVIGRPFDEPRILRVGHAFQQTSRWHLAVPTGID